MFFLKGLFVVVCYFSSSSSLHVTKFLFLGPVTTVRAKQSWYDFAGNVTQRENPVQGSVNSLSKSLSNIPGVVNIRNIFKIIQKISGV